MNKTNHLLIIGFVWPEPNSSAAGSRMIQLVNAFQEHGYDITFASAAAETDHMADLKSLGIRTQKIKVNSSTFDEFIKQLQPSVVLFDRFITEEQFGWRVAKQCPDAVRLLDTEDLHCLRRARQQAVEKDRDFEPKELLDKEVARREVASIYRCDLTLMISEYEMSLLKDLFEVEEHLLCYVPFRVSRVEDEVIEQWPSYEERSHFVTIGNFRHPPNMDGIHYLKNQIWPHIRQQMPLAEMHIYGAYPSQRVRQMHDEKNGFLIKGRAEDAHEVMERGRVCLAPLRFGAGLKGKLIDAMQCGTPSVTTSVGAEGLAGSLDWCGEVTEDAEIFAQKAVSLYQNKEAWSRAQEQGIKIINERFAENGYPEAMIRRMEAIRKELEEHRRSNFMGQMLMHHTLKSTEYMSRWIEAKNS